MKVLLLGSTGLLGNDCLRVLEKEHVVVAPDRKGLDITSWDGVIESFHSISPDVVINCAAFTDVNACEGNNFLSDKTNVEGPRNLAQGAARFDCKLVHLSSDYVYSGQKSVPQPYFEDDPTDPISAYGKMKMHSETAIRENAPDYIIVRSGWLYGFHGTSFIHSILMNTLGKKEKTLRVVENQYGAPTWTFRLAQQINELIKRGTKGTYHATAEGYCSRHDYAIHVFKKLKKRIKIETCALDDYPQPAKRPVNCILENRLLKKQGLNIMEDWKTDLDLFLDEFGGELIKQVAPKKVRKK